MCILGAENYYLIHLDYVGEIMFIDLITHAVINPFFTVILINFRNIMQFVGEKLIYLQLKFTGRVTKLPATQIFIFLFGLSKLFAMTPPEEITFFVLLEV